MRSLEECYSEGQKEEWLLRTRRKGEGGRQCLMSTEFQLGMVKKYWKWIVETDVIVFSDTELYT